MALQRVAINNFRGGLNTRDGPFDLQPNESPDLLNVTISSLVGQLRTRAGKVKINTSASLLNLTVNYSKQCIVRGKRYLMLSVSDGRVFSLDEANNLVERSGGTAGQVWDFEVFLNAANEEFIYMSNGVNEARKWDGEAAFTTAWTLTKKGIVQPDGSIKEENFLAENASPGVLCVWENRMWATYVKGKNTRVYFSEFGDPEATIKQWGMLDIRSSEEDVDKIQDLAVLGSRLFVLKRRSVHFISSPVTLLNRRIGAPGVWDRFQTIEMEDKLYFFNPQGVFGTAGVTIAMESGSINNWFPQNLNKSANALSKARLIVTKDTYPRLLLTMCTGTSLVNNTLIEMVPHINFRRIGGRRYLLLPAFMLHSLPCDSIAAWNPSGVEELIVATTTSANEWAVFYVPPQIVDWSVGGPQNPWVMAQFSEFPTLSGKGEKRLEGWTERKWNTYEGARYNVSEFTRTAVAMTVHFWPAGGQTTGLRACWNATEESGYEVVWGPGTDVQIWRYVKGAKTLLAETEMTAGLGPYALETDGGAGMTVINGTISAWQKKTSGWTKILSAKDSTYTKGYTGFVSKNKEAYATYKIFMAGEIPEETVFHRVFSGETDDGSAIEAHYQTSWIAIQEQEPRERVRRMDVELSGDCIVDVFTDFEAEPRFSEALPKAGEKGEFDEPPATGLAYRFARIRPETYGRYHAVRFRTNAAGNPFLINGAELAIRGGKQH